MARVTKASDAERMMYEGLFPLHGWIVVDGQRCAVEDLRREHTPPDPQYEARAPKGFHFSGYGTHGVFGQSLAHLATRLGGMSLEPCTPECR